MGERGTPLKFDAEAAFVYWYNGGERRTLQDTARQFGCSYNTIRRYADEFDWNGRADEVDAETRRQTNRRIAAVVAKARASDIQVARHMQALFVRRLDPSNPNALTEADVDLRSYIEIGKFRELITGGATERVGGEQAEFDPDEIEAELEEIEIKDLQKKG